MFVQLLISAASRTRILTKQRHYLEWFVRFELTGQEWWPVAKQAFLDTAHLTLQHICLLQIRQKHSALNTNEIGTKLTVYKLHFVVLLIQLITSMNCYCLHFFFCLPWSTGCIAIIFYHFNYMQLGKTRLFLNRPICTMFYFGTITCSWMLISLTFIIEGRFIQNAERRLAIEKMALDTIVQIINRSKYVF